MTYMMRAGFVVCLIGNLIKCSYSELVWEVDKHHSHHCESSRKCQHNWVKICAYDGTLQKYPVWFRDTCTLLEYNCQHNAIILIVFYISFVASHGPPLDRDTEDINMGRKVKKTSAKWCSMAKVCNHDRVPVCGLSHAGDIMGFRDLCDMFDFNCIRRRNYKQTNCPADKNFLTASRKPTNTYYDD